MAKSLQTLQDKIYANRSQLGDMDMERRENLVRAVARSTGDQNLAGYEDAQAFIRGGMGTAPVGRSAQPQQMLSAQRNPAGGRGEIYNGNMPGFGYSGRTGAGAVSMVRGQAPGQGQGPSADDMLSASQRALQSRIDQVRRQYAQRSSEARSQAERQNARVGALTTASGENFSPSGVAKVNRSEEQGQRALDAIASEEAAVIDSLISGTANENLGMLRQRVLDEQQAQQAMVDDLVQAYGLDQQEAQNLRAIALQEAMATGNVGGQSTLDALRVGLAQDQFSFDTEMQRAANMRAEQQLQLDIESARQEGFQPVQYADGTVGYWDYSGETPEFVSIGNFARPVSASRSSTSSSRNGSDVPEGLTGLALLRYQQATGSIPAASSQQGVVNAFNSALARQQAGVGNMTFDPYQLANPFTYPSRGKGSGGGDSIDAAIEGILKGD